MAQTNHPLHDRWLASSQLAPRFSAPAQLAAWSGQRTQLRARLWELLGDLPPRPRVPEVELLQRREEGEYIVEKFKFNNGAGADVAGYLVLPKNRAGKLPAILYCHWHGGEYDIGKEELFQSRHTPEVPALALAKRGFAVMAVDAYCFGERNGQTPGGEKGGAGEMTASKFNLWNGRTLWGMILRDDLMALDYLVSRPEIDASRVGVTGISMGATRTWWLLALDERLKAGVAVACLTRYRDLIETDGLKYHGIYYYVPNVLKYFDTEAVIALIAPRPALFMTGDQDLGSPITGIHKIEKAVRPVYALYGADTAFENRVYPGVGHVYLPEMWERMLEWMEKHVRQQAREN